MKPAYAIALILVIVGAVNWGLVGLFEFDLVAALFGPASILSRVVYSLVGLSGLALAGMSLAAAGSHSRHSMAVPGR
jgi:uncharacterized protein